MSGIPYFRELIFVLSGYTSCVSGDVNKTVTGGNTSDTATVLEYDNTSRKWIVDPDATTDEFDEAEAMTIGSGTGAGTTEGASTKFIYFSEPKDVEDVIIRDHSLYRDHNKAAEDIRDRLRARGYTDDNLDDLLITRDMKQFCIYLANFYTCLRNYKTDEDVWYQKMRKFETLATQKYANLEIAFDSDSDDVIDDSERSQAKLRLIR